MSRVVSEQDCYRLQGKSMLADTGCSCVLAPGEGFAECPSSARNTIGYLEGRPERAATVQTLQRELIGRYTGDVCSQCQSLNMVRTGTCLTCQDCGNPSGGCS